MNRLLLIAFTTLSIHAIAQTNTFPSSGNVGIGTTTPSEKLVVNGSSLIGGTYVNSNNTKLFLQNNAGKTWAISSGANMISENFFSIYNWTDNATQPVLQINESGCVGITANPSDKLQIGSYNNTGNYKINIPGVYNFEQIKLGQYGNGACGLELVNHSDAIPSYGVKLLASVDNGMAGLQIQTAPPANSYNELNYKTRLAITTDGNIGIGTISPQSKLDVSGNLHLNVPSSPNLIDAMTVDVTSFCTNDNAGQSSFFRVRDIGAGNNIPFIIKGNGNVGIGTANPDQSLTVNGKIHATEVIVDLAIPADYVFKPTYKLMPLHEVEQFVKINSHLPEIPSATEITKNGLSMGEMQNKLLQKVEELTLYMISQQKTIDQQQAQIKELNNKLSKLNKQ